MTVLWQPSPSRIEQAQITRFVGELEKYYGLQIHDYADLHEWSIQNPEQFWKALWGFLEIRASREADTVLRYESRYVLPTFADYLWFDGARLNFAENLLRFSDTAYAEKNALISYLENGQRRSVTYRQLFLSVAQLAAALRANGVQVGDRVVGLMPNVIETVVAMLATTSIGAVWSSCSPDFGLQGVLDRFGQIEPKVLFVADGYIYNGKTISLDERIDELEQKLGSVEKLIVVPVLGNAFPGTDSKKVLLSEYIENFSHVTQINFAQLPFDHPLYILYSSGTTGVPKCIVHGAGGPLLQHLKELVLHTDIGPDSVLFYYTTCGWMMWNWLVSGLATGCTVVLYDGSPFHAHGYELWDIAEKENITHFGASAKYFSGLEKIGFISEPVFSLKSLQTILSTGSPLSPESFEYIYRDIKQDVCVSSICGGTDIVSSFVLGNPCLPVYAGEIQCKGLGLAVEVFDENAKSVIGKKGELVCIRPFPSCPIGFWNDADGKKFHAAYFSANEGVWTHGDYAEITRHGGIVVHGRSDAVLNPGGVRIGTAEIYRQVEKLDEVVDSIVIGQQWQSDVRVILFVVLREGIHLDEELIGKIKHTIRSNTTPRHVPAKIIQIDEVPRTISGKIVELAVRNVIHNLPVKNTDALANPQALEQFRHLSELQD
jgi:acetoacetyl-CoA synthetase